MTPDELRSKYLNFFKKRGHAIVPSAPLVPENDPTTLFTGSGMQPIVPYLLGEKHPSGTRIVDSQKCFRSQDIEEVGDNRHTTFFEMLGNWSFGDYFKKEQLEWVWEFLVDEIGIDPDKLFVTCFGGDEVAGVGKDTQAEQIWLDIFEKSGVNLEGKISFYPADKNWWSRAGVPANMPIGEPGGPDSEIFYDFGVELGLHEKSEFKDEKCNVNCDCGRYLEIGNSVFMAFVKTKDGFKELENKNIDFGGGFERILAVIDNKQDVFETGLFEPIIDKLEKLSQKKYSENKVAFRVIADHVKAATLLASDNVFPSNKGQGYFSRRLLRRAIRHGRKIGISNNFVAQLVSVVAKIYADPYPQIDNQKEKIEKIFDDEENKFGKTLEKGLREVNKLTGKRSAKEAFYFYQTYGFPPDIYWEETKEKAEGDTTKEKFISEFDLLRQKHSAQSKTASAGMFAGGLSESSETTTKYHTTTHLLQAALRKILGLTVEQKGSNITEKRLRFDFSFERALTVEEKQKVEAQINTWIKEDLPVSKAIMDKSQALSDGVLAFFADKYPDQATVYSIGTENHYISRELCGGPHITSTSEIGSIEIQKEKSASAGVRRVYIGLKN
jgi:alanyl-tRNA synthetase